MIIRSRLVWKLSAVVAVILTVAIVLSGYVNNLICAHFTLQSARASLHFNSESIVNGIGQLMMTRNNEGIEDLFVSMSSDGTDYQDILLVSHLEDHYGEVKASRFRRDRPDQVVTKLELSEWSCATCHTREDLGGDRPQIEDRVLASAEGGRVLSVMTPIMNQQRCHSCHADDPQILGFLNTDYSLARIDSTVTQRRTLITATVLSSLLFGLIALSLMFSGLLGRPIRRLITGTRRIADNQLDFQFDQRRSDEIGVLEESFNTMITRIQAHRDELRSAMEYLGGMVENSADIIITVTPDRFIETFNRGAEEALGYDRIEVIGQRVEMLFVDPRERETALAQMEETGYVKNYETRLKTKSGKARHVLLTLSYMRDREGNPIGTIGISKDVTHEKNLLDELRHAKEYLEGMVENSADAIISVDSQGLIETFNRGGEQMLGYRREEVIGQPIESLYVNPQERRIATALLDETGSVQNYATRLKSKDGQVRHILLTLSRLRDAEGQNIGTIGISKDISQEKKLQDELRQAKEYLEGMVENSADIIITVSPEGFIQTFNRGAEEALGYPRREAIGRPIEELYADPRDRHRIADMLRRAGHVTNHETALLTKDGEVRNVLLTLSHLRDPEGNVLGTIGISKDVTGEKRLQRQLMQSQKSAAIGQAVTAIQHAIKNMLMSLKGGSYLVRVGLGKDNRDQIEEGRGMIEEGIERIKGLSLNMLDLARDWRPDLESVDVSDMVVSICESNRQQAADRGVTLRHEVPEGLPSVTCDPKLIHMATTDIVVNAFDACTWKEYPDGENAEVVLRCSLIDDGNFFVIEVGDNGCGMTEEIRRHIFTPFFSTKKTLGTGLGLAVTARIITAHEGKIGVESEPDRGTTFRIQLPKDGPQG
jgi:PAS domain S-box-containing protein